MSKNIIKPLDDDEAFANFEIVSKEEPVSKRKYMEPVSKRKYIGQDYYEGDDLTKNKAESEGTGTDFPSNDMNGDDAAETKLMEKVIKWLFWKFILPVATISIILVLVSSSGKSLNTSNAGGILMVSSFLWIGLCLFVSVSNDLSGDKRRTPKSIARKMKGKK